MNVRNLLLAGVAAAGLAACAPQPTPYTVYVPRPGVVWPNSGGIYYPPLARVSPPPNYGTSRPSVVTPDEDTPQVPPSNAGGNGSSYPSPEPQTEPTPPPVAEQPPAPEPTPYEAACSGWWRICHFL